MGDRERAVRGGRPGGVRRGVRRPVATRRDRRRVHVDRAFHVGARRRRADRSRRPVLARSTELRRASRPDRRVRRRVRRDLRHRGRPVAVVAARPAAGRRGARPGSAGARRSSRRRTIWRRAAASRGRRCHRSTPRRTAAPRPTSRSTIWRSPCSHPRASIRRSTDRSTRSTRRSSNAWAGCSNRRSPAFRSDDPVAAARRIPVASSRCAARSGGRCTPVGR